MGSYGPIIQCLLGTGDETDDTKTDEFSEKFRREGGGGGVSFTKKLSQDLRPQKSEE